MREIKQEINLLGQEEVEAILKTRDTAHAFRLAGKIGTILSLAVASAGLFIKAPVMVGTGLAFAAINTVVNRIAAAKEEKANNQIQQLTGKAFIVTGKNKKQEENELQ